jgi:protein gp37
MVSPRIDHLRNAPAKVHFLSVEPLLEDLGELDLTGISWVIVGGESGPGARPINAEWVLSIREQCSTSGVPFFFKQWGGKRKSLNGRKLEGRTYDEYPQRSLIPVPEKAACLARAKSFASSMRKTFSLIQLRQAPA